MAGISLAKIGDLADFPYGLGLSAGFAVLGMLIQFAINKSHEEDEEEEDEEEEEEDVEEEHRMRKKREEEKEL